MLLRLSTAIILMFTTGALIWANLIPNIRHINVKGLNDDGIIIFETGDSPSEYYMDKRGWPFIFTELTAQKIAESNPPQFRYIDASSSFLWFSSQKVAMKNSRQSEVFGGIDSLLKKKPIHRGASLCPISA